MNCVILNKEEGFAKYQIKKTPYSAVRRTQPTKFLQVPISTCYDSYLVNNNNNMKTTSLDRPIPGTRWPRPTRPSSQTSKPTRAKSNRRTMQTIYIRIIIKAATCISNKKQEQIVHKQCYLHIELNGLKGLLLMDCASKIKI